jgi:hypothetical protein
MREDLIAFNETTANFLNWERNWTYISCWHMNDHESAAMWRLYASGNEAIAIQSTFNHLHQCLQPHRKPPHGEPKLGMVYYVDYSSDLVKRNVHLSEFFHKRKSFEHETELRAVIQDLPMIPASRNDKGEVTAWHYNIEKQPISGIPFNIDLDQLIEVIYVSPISPIWLLDLVKSIVNKYNFNKEVKRSGLDSDPVY